MSTENQKPENILAALEAKKGSIAHTMKTTWEDTKRDGMGPVGHFSEFHLNLMMLLRFDQSLAFNITLGMLADHLLPLLTEEEKEALRNESTNLEK
jgi:hypothetical protein